MELEEQTDKQAKREFLINIYNQAFNNINRHITIVWQSVSILVASFVSIVFTEKYEVSIYLSYMILSFYITWMMAHLYDSNHWYTRNIHIVTNIERYFLKKKDKKNLHFFFTKHLKPRHVADTFQIQIYFARAIWVVSYFYVNYKASLKADINFFFISTLLTFFCYFLVHLQRKKNEQNIKELIEKSPGKTINF